MRHLIACLLLLVTAALVPAATQVTPVAIDRVTANGIDYDTYVTSVDATGNYWTNDGSQFLVVDNASGGSLTVTVVWGAGTLAKVDGVAPTNRTFVIPTAKKRLIGPFPPLQYNDVNGYVQITWSTGTSVKCGVFKLTPEKNL